MRFIFLQEQSRTLKLRRLASLLQMCGATLAVWAAVARSHDFQCRLPIFQACDIVP